MLGLRLALTAISVLLLARGASAQTSPTASDERRVALIIGNAAYTLAPLKNPRNDAQDMAKALTKLGFRVTLREDATHREMIEAINAFGQELRKGGVGLFYFAGHGVQSKDGRNFLIPVGATIAAESQIEFDAVDASRVLAAMDDAANGVNLLILDACRDNPFGRNFRWAKRGLAQMEAAQGSYIAFATSPGAVALDGEGRNGLYTHHLLESLKQPDTDVDKVFRRVTADVSRVTGGKQVPWVSSSLTGDFSFRQVKKVAKAAPPVPKADTSAQDRALWDEVKESRNPDELNAYLEKFPDGLFATLARARLKSLSSAKPSARAATATPSVPATSTAPVGPAIASLPFLNEGSKARIEREVGAAAARQKAVALTEAGGWGAAKERTSVEDARAGALENCQTRNTRHPCFLALVNDEPVLKASYTPQSTTEGAIELLKRATLSAEFYFNEERDAGIAPTRSRRTGPAHAPTPRSIPDAKTITTRELVELYKGSKLVLINVLDWTEGAFALPGTVWIQGMGKGSLSIAELTDLRLTLARVAPDRSAPLVVYCLSWECWLSYNATLTASSLGYTNVYWYRGGVSAWNQARLPVVRTKLEKQF